MFQKNSNSVLWNLLFTSYISLDMFTTNVANVYNPFSLYSKLCSSNMYLLVLAVCFCIRAVILSMAVLAVCPIEFPMILRDSLEVLLLNDNQLECVPQSVCGLHNLTELYLSK